MPNSLYDNELGIILRIKPVRRFGAKPGYEGIKNFTNNPVSAENLARILLIN
jgi:hypothetical protein